MYLKESSRVSLQSMNLALSLICLTKFYIPFSINKEWYSLDKGIKEKMGDHICNYTFVGLISLSN